MAATFLSPITGGSLTLARYSSFHGHQSSKWGWRRQQHVETISRRTHGQVFQVLATPNVSPRKKGSNNNVIMVDPLEAKRLAAKQMQEIKAREKYERQRQIEAINGAWAMIGLTAGLVIEGYGGKSILAQLADYWSTIFHFFVH